MVQQPLRRVERLIVGGALRTGLRTGCGPGHQRHRGGEGSGGTAAGQREADPRRDLVGGVVHRSQPPGRLEAERGGQRVLSERACDHRRPPVPAHQFGESVPRAREVADDAAAHGREQVGERGVHDVLAREGGVHGGQRPAEHLLDRAAVGPQHGDHRIATALGGGNELPEVVRVRAHAVDGRVRRGRLLGGDQALPVLRGNPCVLDREDRADHGPVVEQLLRAVDAGAQQVGHHQALPG